MESVIGRDMCSIYSWCFTKDGGIALDFSIGSLTFMKTRAELRLVVLLFYFQKEFVGIGMNLSGSHPLFGKYAICQKGDVYKRQVHNGAVGVVGDDHADDGQHADRRHGCLLYTSRCV